MASTADATESGDTSFDVTEACALGLDRADPLRELRSRFYLPPDTIYLDGNSLGLASNYAESALLRRLEQWKLLGIRGWLEAEDRWFEFAERMGALAATLVGARPDEVVLTGTTTVNLHSLVATFFAPRPGRQRILCEELAFPTDVYALRDQLRLRGCDPDRDLVLVPSRDGRTLDEQEVMARMTDDIALVLLPTVMYRSGQLLDVQRLTAHARDRGITIGFDCSHSVGAVPHQLHDWSVDFAVWCGYKYLNGGPGCTAFLYVHDRHFDRQPGLSGWFGSVKAKQFDMSLDFEHARCAGGWQISSPSILGSAAIEGSLQLLAEVTMEKVRAKSLQLTEYLIFLADALLSEPPCELRVGTPRTPERRGGHVALERERDAHRICRALRARGIVPDYREPNIIRIAPVALYNTFHELWRVAHALREIIETRAYERFPEARDTIP